MKKIFFSIVALAALAACTKSEVAYEASAEIGFAPAVKNITKAAMAKGATLSTDNNLGVWAYWNGVDGTVEADAATYEDYTDPYLANAVFTNRSETVNWGGSEEPYYWPTNGALVFAGYNMPKTGTPTVTAAYSGLTTDVMTFTNFTQSTDLSKTFDLCWFGKTSRSYNNRSDGAAVGVTMSHALTWITIKVKGDATTTVAGKEWKVTKVTLKGVNTVGTEGVCKFAGDPVKPTATWTSNTPADIVVKAAEQTLTNGAVAYESTTDGLVVIPQTPVSLEVEYEYPISGDYKEGKATINLSLVGHKDLNGTAITETIDTWKSGTHYTYTLLFKANEILIAPSYGEWTESNYGVTVE